MGSRVAGKIKLQSVDELLGVPEIAGTQEIELGRIHSFPNHPFKVLDDEKMDTLVESIRENGILNPVIVRPDQNGDYEMISGHRRLHAAGIVGLKKVPAIVKEMSDDEAIIKMVDANIQREEILPSERAFSLKMKMDAMRRQGARVDIDAGAVALANIFCWAAALLYAQMGAKSVVISPPSLINTVHSQTSLSACLISNCFVFNH